MIMAVVGKSSREVDGDKFGDYEELLILLEHNNSRRKPSLPPPQ